MGSQRAFFGVSALLFAASAAVTIVWCASMSAMGGMPMPGGWTMSMAWMRMPGQTWPGAAASFLGMWVVMMVAMMLPSLVPMLWRYRQAVGRTGETRLGRLTTLVGVGYFFVWTVFGMAAFPLGVALAAVEMRQPALARAVPIAVGVVVLLAGALQLTAWKARHLACCREAPGRGRTLPADTGTAWRHGLRLGLHCSRCCAGQMAILLVLGVMDLRAMAVVAAAITVERLAPAGEVVARALGAIIVAAGLFLIARAAHAEAPPRGGQAPGWYRMTLGRFEVTALSDGTVQAPVDQLLRNIKPEQEKSPLARAYLKSPVETSVNGFLVNTGSKLVLIDAGAGGLMGPTLGKLLANLKASGYTPEQVDEVYVTHLHPDHVGGLATADGKAVFPNAVVRLDAKDGDYWLSQKNLDAAPAGMKGSFQGAMASMKPYVEAGRFKPFRGATELVPGIRSVPAYGHTPGPRSTRSRAKARSSSSGAT